MENEQPLADVKVLDFMWAMAGPGSTRILADYGATIVRVESTTRFDAVRMVGPFHDGQPGPESSGLFYNMNTGKLPITLNMSKAQSKEVILDLVRWADVVTESFSPRAMKAWGLDYAALRQVKPDIIMLSTCLMGQTGPLAKFAGFGNLAAAISGFFDPTGWPDRAPAGPFGAYTDYIAPWYNAAAILTALEYKRRTGQGQHIDLSQAEASLHFMAPALLDYTANGTVQSRAGNDDRNYAPHGVYPAAGNDAWIAVATQTEAQWQALCRSLSDPSGPATSVLPPSRDGAPMGTKSTPPSRPGRAVTTRLEPSPGFSRTGFRPARCGPCTSCTRTLSCSTANTLLTWSTPSTVRPRSRDRASNCPAPRPRSAARRLPWAAKTSMYWKKSWATARKRSPSW